MTQPSLGTPTTRHRSPRRAHLALLTAIAATTGALVVPAGTSFAQYDSSETQSASASLIGLTRGARGAEVERLQEALIAKGVAVRGGADGVFGPATAEALSSFQRSNGLEVTGVLDQATAVALGLAEAPVARVDGLARGATGRCGAHPATGAPGRRGVPPRWRRRRVRERDRTRAARLPALQPADRHRARSPLRPRSGSTSCCGGPTLAPRHRVTAATGGSAAADAPAGREWVGLEYGSTGSSVRTLQQRLMDIGIAVRGGADGVFGTVTKAAVEQFQEANGIAVSGRVDDATATALASDGARSTVSVRLVPRVQVKVQARQARRTRTSD